LRRSRAFSLPQPEKPAARIKSAAKAEARRAKRSGPAQARVSLGFDPDRVELALITDDA